MNKEKAYYKLLDFVRILSFIAVLLYHLNILKGGYLAVCTFFVLSGYLSCISAFEKEKFSILEYYKNRLLKIYLPLVIIVFISIPVISLLKEIIWLNLKPETTSVLLGYNNFWQLGANLNYFAHHLNSPFMHLWYIAILLQYELVFPLIFVILKKIGEKVSKTIPIIILLSLALVSTIFFWELTKQYGIMSAYYNSFARAFSFLLGMLLGFIHAFYRILISNKIEESECSKLLFVFYLVCLFDLVLLMGPNQKYFALSMIITTLITIRLIDYAVIFAKNKLSIIDKFIKYVASLGYEIYLVQYPVIFIFEYINVPSNLKLAFIISTIVLLSCIIHFAVSKNDKFKVLRIITRIVLLGISIFGLYKYIVTKDHTKEMENLEKQLEQNQKLIEQNQKNYDLNYKEQQDIFEQALKEIEDDENKLADVVTNLPIVAVGDSVMLGAADELTNKFPNSYVDAQISRTAWVVDNILTKLKNSNKLGNPIIINMGANGDCPEYCRQQIMETAKDKDVFWLSVTNDNEVHFNNKLNEFAKNYSNLHIIDWNNISNGHPEYFVADGIHLTDEGRTAYVNSIYNTIYNFYLKDYTSKKEEIIKNHDEVTKNKISFYGNKALLNMFDILQQNFKDDKFVINKNFDFNLLKNEISSAIDTNTITNKIVLVFDNDTDITTEQYKELIEMCSNQEVYVVLFNEQTKDLNYDNVKVIKFYEELKNNSNYLMPDKEHLSNDGNIRLNEMLNNILKDENSL